jgi:glycosyltransferase involved in cell wall biosynthesis
MTAKDAHPTDVDVVFPCLNEAAALPWVLSRLPVGYRAIVVDNGSTDDSAAVARSLGALVVSEPLRGFGAAAHAGLMASTAEFVAFCDADGSMDPAELPRLVRWVESGSADLVLGRRRPTTFRSWPVHARLANVALAWLMRRATGYSLSDLGPMRAVRRTAMVDLDLRDRRSGYPLEVVLRARENSWSVLELDILYFPRVGKSKVTGTIRGTVNAVRDMSRLLQGLAVAS